MGDRERKEASVGSDESFDIGALPPLMQNLLMAALRDPVRRPLALKRIAEWKERQKAERADKAATPDGTAKSEKKNDASFEMKKGQSLADAKLSGEHTTTKTTRDGDTTDTEQHKTSATLDTDGLAVTHSGSDEQAAADEKSGIKSEHNVGAKVDAHSAHLTGGYGVEAKADGKTHKESIDGSIGIKNGELDAEVTAKQSTDKEHAGGREATRTLGIEGDKAKYGRGHTKTEKDGSSHGSDVSATLSDHSAGVDYGMSSKDASGTSTKTTVGGEIDWKEGSGSVHAGQTIKDKEGNSTSAKVTAGIEVHAEEPVKEGDRWVVRYEKTKSLGGSVGKGKGHGAANLGATHDSFEKGTRSFATEKEAAEFKEHASERIKDEPDARDVGGAMKMGIGESQSHGLSTGLSGGASATFEGASAGASGHEKSTEEVEVTRVSDTVFDVTAKTSIDYGGDVNAGSLVTAKAGASSQQGASTTVRFDLSTSDGKKAFEQFCRDRKVPRTGGKVVATEETKGHERHDGVDVALLGSAQYKSHTSESVRNDDKGKHENYEGDQSHDNDPSWVGKHVFGEDKLHSSVEIDSRQENDKDDGYTLTGKVSGDSGKYNRGKMQHLTGRDENWDEKKVQRSGEWTLVSDVDKKTINSIEKYSDRFKGAKDNDEKMRRLGQWVADDGADAVESIERWGGKDLQWDIELKGDPTFPGRAGRLELEERVRGYADLLAQGNGAQAPTVAAEVKAEIILLQLRHAKVKATSNYTDLPDSLRQQQLALIERQIASVQSIEHRALVESSKNTAGESGVAIAARAANPEGYAKLPPEEQAVAKLRDSIANKDAAIAGNQANSAQAEPALVKAQQHTDWDKPNAGARAGAVGKQLAAARARDQAQRAEYLQLDAMRMELLKHGGDPQQALGVAQALDRALQKSADESADALGRYDDAAHAQFLITKPAGFVGHETFWNDIREDMTDAEYLPDVVDDDGGGARDTDDDDDDKKPRPRSTMKL